MDTNPPASPRFPLDQHTFTPPPISINTTRTSTPSESISESSSSSSPMALPPFSSFFDIPTRAPTTQQRRRPSRPGYWAPQASLLRNESTGSGAGGKEVGVKDPSAMSISSDSRTGSEWGEGENGDEEEEYGAEEVMSLDDLLEEGGKEDTVTEGDLPNDEEKVAEDDDDKSPPDLPQSSPVSPSSPSLRRAPRMSLLTRVSTLLQLESSPILEIESEAALQRLIQASAAPPTPLSSAFRKSTSTYGRFPESAVVDGEEAGEEDSSEDEVGEGAEGDGEEDVSMSEGSVWGMRGSPVLERTAMNGKGMEVDVLPMPSPYRSTPPPFPYPSSRKRKRTPSPSSTPPSTSSTSNSNSASSSTTTLPQPIPIPPNPLKRPRLSTTPSSILLPPFHPSSPTTSSALPSPRPSLALPLSSPRPSISLSNSSPRWARAGLGGGGAYGLGLGVGMGGGAERDRERQQVEGAGDGVRRMTLEDEQARRAAADQDQQELQSQGQEPGSEM